jgi:predicted transcriptional regulator
LGEAIVTVEVDETLRDAFVQAAKDLDCDDAQLLRDFMRAYVQQRRDPAEHDVWFRPQVQIGKDSADAGRLVGTEAVEARFAAKRRATRQRLDAPE